MVVTEIRDQGAAFPLGPGQDLLSSISPPRKEGPASPGADLSNSSMALRIG